MCAPHHQGWDQVHGVPKGYLDPALWEHVLDGLVADDCHFDHLIFQWLGDPSLHPELPRLIRAAATRLAGRVGYLRLDTNGILLTPARVDALLDAVDAPAGPPLLIVFTIDAASAGTYTRTKGRDALPRVQRHVRHLVRARRRRGPTCRVNVQLQFVVQPSNHSEVGAFLAQWSDLLACQGGADWHDEVLFKRLSVSGGGPGQAAADALYVAALTSAGVAPGRVGGVTVGTWEQRPWQRDDQHAAAPRSACPGLWLTPVVRHDGVLVMCCADLHSTTALGSLVEHRFRDLWDGPAATARRLQHLAGRFDDACHGCGGINWYETTPQMAATARTRGRELGLPAAG